MILIVFLLSVAVTTGTVVAVKKKRAGTLNPKVEKLMDSVTQKAQKALQGVKNAVPTNPDPHLVAQQQSEEAEMVRKLLDEQAHLQSVIDTVQDEALRAQLVALQEQNALLLQRASVQAEAARIAREEAAREVERVRSEALAEQQRIINSMRDETSEAVSQAHAEAAAERERLMNDMQDARRSALEAASVEAQQAYEALAQQNSELANDLSRKQELLRQNNFTMAAIQDDLILARNDLIDARTLEADLRTQMETASEEARVTLQQQLAEAQAKIDAADKRELEARLSMQVASLQTEQAVMAERRNLERELQTRLTLERDDYASRAVSSQAAGDEVGRARYQAIVDNRNAGLEQSRADFFTADARFKEIEGEIVQILSALNDPERAQYIRNNALTDANASLVARVTQVQRDLKSTRNQQLDAQNRAAQLSTDLADLENMASAGDTAAAAQVAQLRQEIADANRDAQVAKFTLDLAKAEQDILLARDRASFAAQLRDSLEDEIGRLQNDLQSAADLTVRTTLEAEISSKQDLKADAVAEISAARVAETAAEGRKQALLNSFAGDAEIMELASRVVEEEQGRLEEQSEANDRLVARLQRQRDRALDAKENQAALAANLAEERNTLLQQVNVIESERDTALSDVQSLTMQRTALEDNVASAQDRAEILALKNQMQQHSQAAYLAYQRRSLLLAQEEVAVQSSAMVNYRHQARDAYEEMISMFELSRDVARQIAEIENKHLTATQREAVSQTTTSLYAARLNALIADTPAERDAAHESAVNLAVLKAELQNPNASAADLNNLRDIARQEEEALHRVGKADLAELRITAIAEAEQRAAEATQRLAEFVEADQNRLSLTPEMEMHFDSVNQEFMNASVIANWPTQPRTGPNECREGEVYDPDLMTCFRCDGSVLQTVDGWAGTCDPQTHLLELKRKGIVPFKYQGIRGLPFVSGDREATMLLRLNEGGGVFNYGVRRYDQRDHTGNNITVDTIIFNKNKFISMRGFDPREKFDFEEPAGQTVGMTFKKYLPNEALGTGLNVPVGDDPMGHLDSDTTEWTNNEDTRPDIFNTQEQQTAADPTPPACTQLGDMQTCTERMGDCTWNGEYCVDGANASCADAYERLAVDEACVRKACSSRHAAVTACNADAECFWTGSGCADKASANCDAGWRASATGCERIPCEDRGHADASACAADTCMWSGAACVTPSPEGCASGWEYTPNETCQQIPNAPPPAPHVFFEHAGELVTGGALQALGSASLPAYGYAVTFEFVRTLWTKAHTSLFWITSTGNHGPGRGNRVLYFQGRKDYMWVVTTDYQDSGELVTGYRTTMNAGWQTVRIELLQDRLMLYMDDRLRQNISQAEYRSPAYPNSGAVVKWGGDGSSGFWRARNLRIESLV